MNMAYVGCDLCLPILAKLFLSEVYDMLQQSLKYEKARGNGKISKSSFTRQRFGNCFKFTNTAARIK